jgi:hypothetical protein
MSRFLHTIGDPNACIVSTGSLHAIACAYTYAKQHAHARLDGHRLENDANNTSAKICGKYVMYIHA